MVKVYYFMIGDEQEENNMIEHKDEASCSSKDEAVEKPKKSDAAHSKKVTVM
jgi:OTU domain-containing protein 3